MSADYARMELASTTLASAEYSAPSAQLMLVFRNGSRYLYSGVPMPLFTALVEAPSHGTFFNRQIRDRFGHVRLA